MGGVAPRVCLGAANPRAQLTPMSAPSGRLQAPEARSLATANSEHSNDAEPVAGPSHALWRHVDMRHVLANELLPGAGDASDE
jgi:hypothetical protein